MKNRARIVTGSALALVMAASTVTAAPQLRMSASAGGHTLRSDSLPRNTELLLAQAEDEGEISQEELLRRQEQEEERLRQEQQQQEEAPPAEEAPAAEEPQPQPEPEAQPEPEPEAPAAEEPSPEAQQPPAEEAPPPAEEIPTPEEAPVPQQEPGEETPTPEEAPVPEDQPPASEQPAEQPAPPASEEAPAPEQQPAEEAVPPTGEEAPAPEQQPAEEAVPPASEEAPTPEQQPAEEAAPPTGEEAPTPEQQPAEEAVPPAGEEAPTPEPAPEQQPTEETAPPPAQEAPAQPAPEAAPAPEQQAPAETQPVEPEQGTPILDSQKEGEGAASQPAEQQPAAAPSAPPPTSDAEAQQLQAPVEVQPLRLEEGRRIDRRDERMERREGTDVLREIGDRLILNLGSQTIVRSDDRDRMERDAREVYYEELPRGRSRETIVRPNGVQVVTIRDRYGDIIRRSRIMPDGHEYVLVYAGDRDGDRGGRHAWRDPARDLPPLHLTIPVEDYILDARRAEAPEDYYDFFEQPPVEPVRRLYSIDDVKYSARLRDSVRRVDLDTITFEFGSASIAESEVQRLEGVATAMARLLDENPAETFLIEGHTDAVGSDEANLALSDRRAESVAAALTNVFGIPPENLVTQGYGERYLKINTADPERVNRRVAMRRITPLVAPVAQAR